MECVAEVCFKRQARLHKEAIGTLGAIGRVPLHDHDSGVGEGLGCPFEHVDLVAFDIELEHIDPVDPYAFAVVVEANN